MKTIASLNGVEFLRACNNLRNAAEEFMMETGVGEIRKRMPELTEDMTVDQKKAAIYDQSKKNLAAMMEQMLSEKPEATYKMLRAAVITDNDEELSGFEIIDAATSLMASKKVLDFLTLLVK